MCRLAIAVKHESLQKILCKNKGFLPFLDNKTLVIIEQYKNVSLKNGMVGITHFHFSHSAKINCAKTHFQNFPQIPILHSA